MLSSASRAIVKLNEPLHSLKFTEAISNATSDSTQVLWLA